jgi:hypothetical protein
MQTTRTHTSHSSRRLKVDQGDIFGDHKPSNTDDGLMGFVDALLAIKLDAPRAKLNGISMIGGDGKLIKF